MYFYYQSPITSQRKIGLEKKYSKKTEEKEQEALQEFEDSEEGDLTEEIDGLY